MAIKIFVGCAANTEDAESQAVLEYTIRKHTPEPVEITWMMQSHDPESPFYGWDTSRWATPFSGFRWAIPELCDYEGRAIYMDSDVIVMRDIAELWYQPIEPGKIVLAKGKGASWRYCVSLWDCERAKEYFRPLTDMQRDPNAHKMMCKLMASRPDLVQPFIGNWNCLDGEKYDSLTDPDIGAIHYTSMAHQPHHPYAAARLADKGLKHWFDGNVQPHPREDMRELFGQLLIEASENGYPVSKYEHDNLFGPYNKKSVAGQGKTKPAWMK